MMQILAVALITNARGTVCMDLYTASVRDKCNSENGGQSILFQE